MNKPLFSIIVPVYKVEKYLDRCVISAQNQTYDNIEIILVDDGSPDNCPAMCDEYAKADSRIKVIHKENGGLSDARNAGIASANGEYIILLDSDDCVETDACEKFAAFAKSSPDIMVGAAFVEGADFALDNSTDFTSGTGLEYLKTVLYADRVQMAAVLYVLRRAFLSENGLRFKKGILHEDEEFTPRALLAAKSVVNTSICFYRYVIRADSITTKQDKRKNIDDIYNTGVELIEKFSEVGDGKFRRFFRDRLVRAYLHKYTESNAYTYGREYVHRGFVLKNACRPKTKIHACIFAVSPKLYCKMISKLRGGRK